MWNWGNMQMVAPRGHVDMPPSMRAYDLGAVRKDDALCTSGRPAGEEDHVRVVFVDLPVGPQTARALRQQLGQLTSPGCRSSETTSDASASSNSGFASLVPESSG